MLRLNTLIIAILIQTLLLSTFTNAEDYELHQAKGGNHKTLKINYYHQKKSWDTYASKIDILISDLSQKLNRIFRAETQIPLDIILLKNETLQEKFKLPEWVKAFYHKEQIFISINETQPLILDELRKTIKHELAHAYIYKLSNGKAPVWFDEGLAKLLEDLNCKSDFKQMRNWLKRNKTLPARQINKSFTLMAHQQSKIAYVQSKLMIRYLLNISNIAAARNYLLLLKTEQENAFKEAFAIDQLDFFRNFSHWVRHQK